MPAKKKNKKVRTPEKQYLDFHHKFEYETLEDTIDLPDKLIHIGKAVGIVYESDKFDGKKRHYIHKFKTLGNVLMEPENKRTGNSSTIILNNLKCRITPRGITG